MPLLPDAIMLVLVPFAPLFSQRVWLHAQLLLVGAMPFRRSRTSSWSRQSFTGSGTTPPCQHNSQYLRVIFGRVLTGPLLLFPRTPDPRRSCPAMVGQDIVHNFTQGFALKLHDWPTRHSSILARIFGRSCGGLSPVHWALFLMCRFKHRFHF